jgi:hypothetical protein
MTDRALKNPRHEDSEPIYERAEIDGVEFARDADGQWRYADSWILVPGARDKTLTERFRPKRIVNADQEIERVVLSAGDIAEAPELLDWCLAEGTPILGEGELIEVLVPYEKWQARDRIPGELISPEHEGTEAEQQVAVAEREYREAEQRLERAADYRAEVLRRHSEEMTRQEARTITGLSVGRIQQLIRERMDDLDVTDMELLSLIKRHKPKSIPALHRLLGDETGIIHPTELIKGRVLSLGRRELLKGSGKEGLRITTAGEEALEAFLPRYVANDPDDVSE